MPKENLTILVNEDPQKMMLGLNTSLLYMLLAGEKYENVYLVRVDENQSFPNGNFEYYEINQQVAKSALEQYQSINKQIRESSIEPLSLFVKKLEDFEISDTLKLVTKKGSLISSEDLQTHDILNRVEPMKTPFPPEGNHDLQEFFSELIKKFADIHAPLGLCDKEVIEGLSTPSQITDTEFRQDSSQEFQSKIKTAIAKYQELYPHSTTKKIVLKPQDSAQSLGVFSIEFTNDNHQAINSDSNLDSLEKQQIYQVDQSVLENPNKLLAVVKKLCELQNQGEPVTNLYGSKLMIQPFLEGIEIGDFRVIILKDSDKKFFSAGTVFRKKITSLDIQQQGFTTCATAGQARPCSSNQYDDQLNLSIQKTLDHLNGNPEKYRHIDFIGADFISKDKDAKSFFLGELNFNCPALISLLGKDLDYVRTLPLFKDRRSLELTRDRSSSRLSKDSLWQNF